MRAVIREGVLIVYGRTIFPALMLFFFFNGRVRLSCFMETVFHSLICLFFCAPVALVVVLRRLKGVSVVDGRAVFRPLVCSFFLSP